jgi:hypothetical protein
MEERFEIQHVTLQLECGNGAAQCRQEPEDVV